MLRTPALLPDRGDLGPGLVLRNARVLEQRDGQVRHLEGREVLRRGLRVGQRPHRHQSREVHVQPRLLHYYEIVDELVDVDAHIRLAELVRHQELPDILDAGGLVGPMAAFRRRPRLRTPCLVQPQRPGLVEGASGSAWPPEPRKALHGRELNCGRVAARRGRPRAVPAALPETGRADHVAFPAAEAARASHPAVRQAALPPDERPRVHPCVRDPVLGQGGELLLARGCVH
mmetsp:Transcript_56292/g.163226  ORF Transcript_56292/g.163226 Transcript_56292/m.163226 type:complete len:231 (+) Transcript_56292:1116-1808(+)